MEQGGADGAGGAGKGGYRGVGTGEWVKGSGWCGG